MFSANTSVSDVSATNSDVVTSVIDAISRSTFLARRSSKGLKRGVTNLCFSGDGSQICVVGNDDDHSHFIFRDRGGRWSKAIEVANGKGDKSKVLWVQWDEKGTCFVSGGFKFVKVRASESRRMNDATLTCQFACRSGSTSRERI